MDIFSGVVLEKHKGFAIILTADGQFKKIKVNENYEVGQEVFGKEFSSRSGMYRRIAGSVAVAAALFMAVLVPGLIKEDNGSSNTITASSEKTSKTVVAYVKVDINPSLQLGVDEQLMVKEAIPLNKDGERVLAEAQLNNHNISDAMELVTESCYELGYISDDKENVVNLTLISDPIDSGKIDKVKLEQDVQTKVEKVLGDKNLKGEVKDFKELSKASVEKAVKTKNNNKGSGNAAEQTNSGVINKNSYNPQKDAITESERTDSKDKANKSKTKNESKEQVKDNSPEKGLGKQNPSTGNSSEAKQDKKVKTKPDSSNTNGPEKSSSGNKGSSKTNPSDNKATKKQEEKDNKESKEKEKGRFGDNELGSRLPWYKIFELG